VVPVNAPKINIGPSSYYAGYPYGYVPYNTRFLYPPYNPTRVNPATGQTGVGNAVSKPRVATGSLLGSTPRHNFQYDDREVLAVQTALRRLGYYTGPLDGILGPDTKAAIVNYQTANKQAVTGFIDRATLSTLGVITK
jgi:peptidoglycan hydrolase-like protein with peptidoglycan-binding domain